MDTETRQRTPRVLIAPAPYKDCLDASSVADAIEIGVRQALADVKIEKLPLCDGGTGIGDRLIEAKGGRKVVCDVHDPLMRGITSEFVVLADGTAVVESAKAAGLALVQPRHLRNPLNTTTYGVGELIKAAVDHGCEEIIVGCGDSATNDGGVGMAQALGVRFDDQEGRPVTQGGAALGSISTIDTTGLCVDLTRLSVLVACNMTSILCGDNGTTRCYAAQKGANPEAIEVLEASLDHYADLLTHHLGHDIRYLPGTGGAGGLSAGLYAFLNARLRYSMDVVSEALNLEEYISRADLVITGEGMTDAKTASGKAPCAAGLIAKKHGVPTVAIAGSLGDDVDIAYFHGLDMIECIQTGPISLKKALDAELTRRNIVEATVRTMRSIKRRMLL